MGYRLDFINLENLIFLLITVTGIKHIHNNIHIFGTKPAFITNLKKITIHKYDLTIFITTFNSYTISILLI